MLYINNAILRKGYTPNTFIGGVGSTITSASSIATILDVPENWIKNFNIVDDDIEFHIRKEYEIPNYAFQDNDDITYYRDEGAMCFGIGQGAFIGCVELEEFKGLAVVWVGGTDEINSNGSFRDCVKLKRFITSEAWITCNINAFNGCTLLEEIDFSTVYIIRGYGNYIFRDCKNLPPITINPLYTGALSYFFQGAVVSELNLNNVSGLGIRFFGYHDNKSTVLFSTLYSEHILALETQAVYSVLGELERVEFPNCISIGDWVFYRSLTIKEILLPKVTVITGEFQFGVGANESSSLELIDLRSLKSFGTSTDSFLNISTHGVIIKLHEDIDPNDPNITYAQSRNAIIKLYDDNGNYVSDL